jgi:adenylosuccinate synthase
MKQGKINIIIDGQFGSTGKGLYSSFLSKHNHVDIALSSAGPNAGHTFDMDDGLGPRVAYHLPISGIINDRSTIFLTAGSIIDPDILLDEIERFEIEPWRLYIDPRAAVIEDVDKTFEKDSSSSVASIASTQKGVGSALSRKILRSSTLAKESEKLKPFVRDLDIHFYLNQGCTAFMEVAQGFGLSLNSGLAYPYCTSREVTVTQALVDAQLHPKHLGDVYVIMRTFPIRVGHLIVDDEKVGDSGPFYDDSIEISWDYIGVQEELTTNTKRVRRVATFSFKQLEDVIEHLNPDYLMLNFCNHLSENDLDILVNKINEKVNLTHLGFGPKVTDVKEVYGKDWNSR